jgi:hypothetical protein
MNRRISRRPVGVRNTGIDFTAESTKSSQSRGYGVRSVSGHDDNVRTRLEPASNWETIRCSTAPFVCHPHTQQRNWAEHWSTRTYLLSPAILLIISGPLIRKKNVPVSFATAPATRVLPVPGGPNVRILCGGFIPIDLNSWGWRRDSSTSSRICAICCGCHQYRRSQIEFFIFIFVLDGFTF